MPVIDLDFGATVFPRFVLPLKNLRPEKIDAREPNRPPTVLHLIETLGSGGAERLLYTNLKYFPRAAAIRHQVLSVSAGADYWVEAIQQLGVPVGSLECRNGRDLVKGTYRLRTWLRRNRVDLIHTHLWGANIIGRVAGRAAGIPVISSAHNPDYEPEAWNDGSSINTYKRKLIRELDSWTARWGCRRMIAVSQYVRQSVHHHLRFPMQRIDLVYNPVDVDELKTPSLVERRELLNELRLRDDSLLLLNVARISPQKGLLYAIRAMPAIRKQFPRAQLLSVGAADDEAWFARLRNAAAEEGVTEHVHFLGARRDVPDLLKVSDVFVFPSLHEGLGIALVEAMVIGRACVATKTGPIPEVICDKVNGLLVPPGDVEALADAVCSFLENDELRQEFGARAVETALPKFEPRYAAAKLAEIYQSVARNE